MEKDIASRFVGKFIAFKKVNSDMILLGKLIEVTNNCILIEFKGRLQSHMLAHIIEMEEMGERRNGV
ncbi:MAG: hypothetical protein QXY62_05935 [Candidatus Altiarchaeota archaeon]